MYKNTFLFISFLAVVSALIIGVNIGKRLSSQSIPENNVVTANPSPTAMALPTATPKFLTYENTYCGISFRYPLDMKYVESASSSALFTSSAEPRQSFAVACQPEIPAPPLDENSIEVRKIASLSAFLYHDANPKDGSPIDKLIFHNPAASLDIVLAGYGPVFTQVIDSLSIIQ